MTNGGSGDGRLSKNQRREAAREKAAILREQHKKKERRGKWILQGSLIVVSLAIVASVTLIIVNSIRPPSPGPQNMLSDGITIGEGFAAVPTAAIAAGEEPVETTQDPESDALAIQIWVDYQCPICAEFEEANNEQISTLIEQGVATIEINPVAILDRASQGERYSTRAANAAACVANYSPDTFYGFNQLMFANQPEEQTTGLTDEEIFSLAEDAGVQDADSIEECITGQDFRRWVTSATDRATSDPALLNADGQFGTPTVLVNGQRYEGAIDDAAQFAQFIASADGAAFSEESSASPSPSPTP